MKIFSNLNKLSFSSPESRAKIIGAVNYFTSGKGREAEAKKYQAALQAFGVTGDFPTSVLPLIEKFHALPAYDEGYKEIFDIRDFTGSKRDGFKIADVEDGLSFAEVPIGEKVKIFGMSGTEVTVNFGLYGGGLGWRRTLIDDEDYWTLEDNARAFINKAYEHKAATYYALIEAIGAGRNITWQTHPDGVTSGTANYTAGRDAATLDKAAETILINLKDKGYGITPMNAQFKVLVPLQLVGRLNRALGLLIQGFGGSPNQVSYKFNLVPTTMLATTNVYYVCLPKIKAKGGDRMNLTVFDKWDPEAYTDAAIGWMRYGGAIGDTEQFQRCATS